jgi:hypothetical protein
MAGLSSADADRREGTGWNAFLVKAVHGHWGKPCRQKKRGVCTPVLDQLALQITIALVGAVLVA